MSIIQFLLPQSAVTDRFGATAVACAAVIHSAKAYEPAESTHNGDWPSESIGHGIYNLEVKKSLEYCFLLGVLACLLVIAFSIISVSHWLRDSAAV